MKRLRYEPRPVMDWVLVIRARAVLGCEAFCMDWVSVFCFSRSRAVALGFGEAEVLDDEGVASSLSEVGGIAKDQKKRGSIRINNATERTKM